MENIRGLDPIVVPPLFLVPIAVAVAVQIGTTAAGLAGAGDSPGWLLAAGLGVFLAVAATQLVRLRRFVRAGRRNGLWPSGVVHRVLGGTSTAASTSYVLGLAGAMWAAFAGAWWLVAVCAVAGGAAYALSGRSWMRKHGSEPSAPHGGAPVKWVVAATASLTGLILLLAFR